MMQFYFLHCGLKKFSGKWYNQTVPLITLTLVTFITRNARHSLVSKHHTLNDSGLYKRVWCNNLAATGIAAGLSVQDTICTLASISVKVISTSFSHNKFFSHAFLSSGVESNSKNNSCDGSVLPPYICINSRPIKVP